MKKLGIMGGVGPETTSNFYLYIISQYQKFRNVAKPNLLIHNLPIPHPGVYYAGVSLVLLACTYLQALILQHSNIEIVDTMQLLADEVVRQIHSNV